MAHVLLPCDLPSWTEVRGLLSRLGECRGAMDKVAAIMTQVHEASSVSLDPEDSHPVLGHPGFERLQTFLLGEEGDGNNNRVSGVLSHMADWAARLPALKPRNGLHYSLTTEEGTLSLDRRFVVSLLSNAFFCTFPRRKAKTHPTLQDFSMAEFFTHLDKESHQKKLRAFLHYFENLEPEPDGTVMFTRKVFRGPTLPGWLCSERPLVPLVVRPQGSIDEAEPWVFRGCSCSSKVGGDVLTESTSQESALFFEFPELLSSLCFFESLVEGEALIVEGVRAPNTQEVNFCFLDVPKSGEFDDLSLLRSLNKAVAAFTHEPRFVDRRRTPDGGESSDDGMRQSLESREKSSESKPRNKKTSRKHSLEKSLSQASSKFSLRTASESSSKLDDEYYTADEESESVSAGSVDTRSSEIDPTSDCPRQSSSGAASLRSLGFVLAHNSEDEDEDSSLNINRHERLEDFRRRIRRRTRRRLSSHRRSCSSYSGCSSSDMEDITEDPEESVRPVVTIRPACSEPSLVALADSAADIPSWVSPEALLSISGQKQLAATCSGGHLKSYSHDGVRPNLPVPFRARFRTKRKTSSGSSDISTSISCAGEKEWLTSRCPVAVTTTGGNEDPQLRALVLWLAASMAQLPALILYTMNDPALKEVIQVYNQVLNRHWTVGDLACEVLRFCRNQIMPGHRAGKHPHLFGQLMADDQQQEERPPPPTQNRKIFTEESLD